MTTTSQNDLPADVAEFMASVEPTKRAADGNIFIELMQKITGHGPKMWGASLIGFDTNHYKYDSGREGDSFVVGLSPRKAKLVIYINPGFQPYQSLIGKLGKHKSSVSCLYINKLDDIDLAVLETLITQAYKEMKLKYPDQ